MTALADVLRELAVRVPERVRAQPDESGNMHFYVYVRIDGGHWRHVGVTSQHHEELPTESGAVWLEHALREEIQARGWYLTLLLAPQGEGASIILETQDNAFDVYADTPPHAIALALLAALGPEQEQKCGTNAHGDGLQWGVTPQDERKG